MMVKRHGHRTLFGSCYNFLPSENHGERSDFCHYFGVDILSDHSIQTRLQIAPAITKGRPL